MNDKTVTMLLVEDDDADFESFRRSLIKLRIANPLIRARDGREGLELLRSEQVAHPFIILLDLNMPGMNGFEFLHEIRNDSALHDSVVFVLTTSDEEKDKVRAYQKNIAGYITKANAGSNFVNLMDLLQLYWRYVELPPRQITTLGGGELR